jgi:hypothetical protein
MPSRQSQSKATGSFALADEVLEGAAASFGSIWWSAQRVTLGSMNAHVDSLLNVLESSTSR